MTNDDSQDAAETRIERESEESDELIEADTLETPAEGYASGDEISPGDDDTSSVDRIVDSRYRLDAELDSGGMGTVYRAEHTMLEKDVAVKILHAELSGQPELTERFRREAKAAAHLDHPHVCAATDFGLDEDGHFYMVMELLEGETLAECIEREGALEMTRALELLEQLTSALARAHEMEIVHRDLKPENVLLVEEGPGDLAKILDFGIARVRAGDDERLTQTGAVLGTPAYMSPEQAAGDPIDPRTDLYALGLLAFEMLTGRPVFQAERGAKLMAKQVSAPPPTLSEAAPDRLFPARLEEVVQQLLSKDPDERPDSAESLLETWKNLQAGETSASTGGAPSETRTDSNDRKKLSETRAHSEDREELSETRAHPDDQRLETPASISQDTGTAPPEEEPAADTSQEMEATPTEGAQPPSSGETDAAAPEAEDEANTPVAKKTDAAASDAPDTTADGSPRSLSKGFGLEDLVASSWTWRIGLGAGAALFLLVASVAMVALVYGSSTSSRGTSSASSPPTAIRDELEEARSRYEERPKVAKALKRHASGRTSEALEMLRTLQEGDTTSNPHLAYLLGTLAFEGNQPTDALEQYERAIELNADYALHPRIWRDALDALDGSDEVRKAGKALAASQLDRRFVRERIARAAWRHDSSEVRDRAYQLLTSNERFESLPAWLQQSIELRHSRGCEAHREHIDELVSLRNPKGLRVLRFYQNIPKSGCGTFGTSDCFGCIRSDLREAIEALTQTKEDAGSSGSR